MPASQQSDTGANNLVTPRADSNEFAEAVELLHGDAGEVTGNTVAIEQSTAGSVTGEQVTVSQSAVKRLEAGSAQLSQSAAFILKSADTALSESAAGIITGGQTTLVNSTVGIAHGPLTVASGTARVFVQIGNADSSIKPMLDSQGALRLGVGLGFSLVVFSRLLRRVLGR
jgi:hypothetical protein